MNPRTKDRAIMNMPHRFHQQVVLKFFDKYTSLRDIIHKLNKHSVLTVFLISSVIILPFNLLSDAGLYYDSFDYFELAETFDRHGFSFLNYHNETRGYFFSFTLYLLQGLAEFLRIDPLFFFRLCFGLLITVFISWLVPAYFEALTHLKVGFLSRLLFALLVIYFWQGYFLYPLTDLPALILLVVCIYALLRSTNRPDMKPLLRSILLVAAGIALSTSMITRPSYLIVLLPIFIYLLLLAWKTFPDNVKRMAVLVSFAIGLVLGWMPQTIINLQNFHILSPFVHAQVAGGNLYESHLSWGIVVQRYETNIEPDFKNPRVVFNDQHGLNIRQNMKINSSVEFFSPRQYILLLIQYPVDFAILYFRHLFNGMDITYRTPYVDQLNRGRVIFSLLNYSLQFIFLAAIITRLPVLLKEKRIIAHIVILVLPAFLSLPGAVEVRFFLPVYFIMYLAVTYLVLPRFRFEWLEQRLHIFFPLYLLYVLVCFAMSASAFMSIENLSYVFTH
jgi:hypothetical protein